MGFTGWKSSLPRGLLMRQQQYGCMRIHHHQRIRHYVVQGSLPERGIGVAVGHHAQMERTFTIEDVKIYGSLIGDLNPIHQAMDITCTNAVNNNTDDDDDDDWEAHRQAGLIQLEEDGRTTKVLVHGMLASSIFSSIFATRCPGAVYLSQELQFKSPIFCHDMVVGRIDVTQIRGARRQPGIIITCRTEVLCHQRACVQGKANVWLPKGSTD